MLNEKIFFFIEEYVERNEIWVYAIQINEVKKTIGPAVDKFPILCSDSSILRFLRARNWNTNRASKMLKEAIRWRLQYKPEKICWVSVAQTQRILSRSLWFIFCI